MKEKLEEKISKNKVLEELKNNIKMSLIESYVATGFSYWISSICYLAQKRLVIETIADHQAISYMNAVAIGCACVGGAFVYNAVFNSISHNRIKKSK